MNWPVIIVIAIIVIAVVVLIAAVQRTRPEAAPDR